MAEPTAPEVPFNTPFSEVITTLPVPTGNKLILLLGPFSITILPLLVPLLVLSTKLLTPTVVMLTSAAVPPSANCPVSVNLKITEL